MREEHFCNDFQNTCRNMSVLNYQKVILLTFTKGANPYVCNHPSSHTDADKSAGSQGNRYFKCNHHRTVVLQRGGGYCEFGQDRLHLLATRFLAPVNHLIQERGSALGHDDCTHRSDSCLDAEKTHKISHPKSHRVTPATVDNKHTPRVSHVYEWRGSLMCICNSLKVTFHSPCRLSPFV